MTGWISHVLEFLWLFTLVAVPLAFVDRETFLSESELAYVEVPKTVLLRTMVALMAVLWLVEWALERWFQREYPIAGQMPYLHFEDWLKNLADWLKRNPTRWVILAVVLYLVSTLLSTALSESFRVSMWGLVPGQDTYPAYTITCYVVLFGVIATHVKRKAQVRRLLWAIALMGVLVGGYSVAQHYGYDIFTLLENPGTQRSGSTMGNAILAGSVLLMTIPISMAAGTADIDRSIGTARVKWIAGLWVLVLTLQLLGIIFTFSRGSWIGVAIALSALLTLMLLFSGWRQFLRASTLLGLAAAAAVLVASVPAESFSGDRPQARTYFSGRQPAPPSLIPSVASSISSIGRETLKAGGGGLSGRIGIWETSGRLIIKRPWFEFDGLSLPLLRVVIGYGPDMFKYTYLLEKLPRGPERTVASERFAHNLFVHRGVELGLLGLLATLGLFASPAIVGLYHLFRRRQGESTFYNLLMLGLMAALAGRFTEQLVGVAAVSDLTVFWVLLALFATLPAAAEVSQTAPRPAQVSLQGQRTRRYRTAARMMIPGAPTVVPAVVALLLIAGIGALTWTKSINYLEAGFKAREGLDRIRDAKFQNALGSLDRAIELAPGVSVYHTLRASVYAGYRRQDNGHKEPECDRLPDDTQYKVCLTRLNYLSHREATMQRPFEWLPHLNLAQSALTLALMTKDSDMASEAIRLYGEVAQLDPQAWWSWEQLAAAHIQVGRPEAALEPLEKSLAILDGIPRSAISRLLQGIVYLELDRPSTALAAFDEAIRLNPVLADAYINRGASYNALGQYQRAVLDLDEAIKLNPEMAMAYNNRGNSFGNLDQLQRALEDFDEAIRLDNRFALAYSNRALVYTYLGRDDEARVDVDTAAQLGVAPGPILAKMEEVRASR